MARGTAGSSSTAKSHCAHRRCIDDAEPEPVADPITPTIFAPRQAGPADVLSGYSPTTRRLGLLSSGLPPWLARSSVLMVATSIGSAR